MKKLASLLICSIFLVSCLVTPGLKEPSILECVILTDKAVCEDLTTGDAIELPLSEVVGFIAVSPSDYSKISNHHDALHSELNRCVKKKK